MTATVDHVEYIIEHRLTFPGNRIFIPGYNLVVTAPEGEIGKHNWIVIASYTFEQIENIKQKLYKS